MLRAEDFLISFVVAEAGAGNGCQHTKIRAVRFLGHIPGWGAIHMIATCLSQEPPQPARNRDNLYYGFPTGATFLRGNGCRHQKFDMITKLLSSVAMIVSLHCISTASRHLLCALHHADIYFPPRHYLHPMHVHLHAVYAAIVCSLYYCLQSGFLSLVKLETALPLAYVFY